MNTGKNHCIPFSALILLFIIIVTQSAFSTVYNLTDPNDVDNQSYSPGDEIIIADGTYHDKIMSFSAVGTAGSPIVLRAENPGGVILDGGFLRMNGAYCIVKWFMFTNIDKETVAYRNGSYANNCRVTECAFVNSTTQAYKWVSFYGTYNRLDHCAFVNCRSEGAMITVWRPESSANYHRIDHNYIANRRGGGVDVNGYETMRIGDSTESQSDSYTVVEYNFISNIYDADIEFISSKSGRNIYRYNTFRACGGGLTLRHGKSCTVEGNFFFGDGADNTVGIRMTDTGHVIINNYIENLDGHSTSSKDMWNCLVMMAGQSGPALNGYWPVADIIVANNTFVNNDNVFTIGYENQGGDIAPQNITLANNCVQGTSSFIFDSSSGSTTGFGSGLICEGNIMNGGSQGSDAPASGISWIDPDLVDTGTYYRPDTGSPCIGGAAGTYSMVSNDMDGQERNDGAKDVGADEVSAQPILRGVLQATETGPPWYWGLYGPNAPSALSLNPVSISQINISWTDNSSDEIGFYIYRNTTDSKPAQAVHTNTANDTTWNNSGLSENTMYYYWIEAFNGNGESIYVTSSATTLANPPAAPSGLSATAVSSSQVNLDWTDNSANEDGFYIYCNNVNSKPVEPAYTNNTDQASLSVSDLTELTTYYFWVEAFNITANSTAITATAVTPMAVPDNPSGLGYNPVSSDQIDIYWTDNSDNEDGFYIYISAVSTKPALPTQTNSANDNTWSATGLNSSTLYYIWLEAFNAGGTSATLNGGVTTPGVPPPVPLAPSGLNAISSASDQVDLTWTDNSSNENGFLVYYNTVNSKPPAASFTNTAGLTSRTITGLTENTVYYFWVESFNVSGASSHISQSVTTPAYVDPQPQPPTDLELDVLLADSLELKWTDNSVNEDMYIVFWVDNSQLNHTNYMPLPADTTAYTIKNLEASNHYIIWVEARNVYGTASSGHIVVRTKVANTLMIIPSYIGPDLVQARIQGIPWDLEVIKVYNMNGEFIISFETQTYDGGDGYLYRRRYWDLTLSDRVTRIPSGIYYIPVYDKVLTFIVE